MEDPVFIPRQETETLVNWICKNISEDKAIKFADLGAGVGTIALSILSRFPNSECKAIELHSKSIKCLKKNSKILKVQNRLHILKKDISNIQSKDLFSFTALDLITANPPYIDPKDKTIHSSVYLHESPLALFSDKEGMEHIISWLKKALELLKPKGIYIFEFAWNQKKQIINFLNNQTKIKSYQILKDNLGHPRVAVCFKKNLLL